MKLIVRAATSLALMCALVDCRGPRSRKAEEGSGKASTAALADLAAEAEPGPKETPLEQGVGAGGLGHKNFEHGLSEAVVVLSSHDRGEDHCWIFDFYLFKDGCYRMYDLRRRGKKRTGAIPQIEVSRFLVDAETFRFRTFPSDLTAERHGCPLKLLVTHEGEYYQVKFTPLSSPTQFAALCEVDALRASQVAVSQLLARRLLAMSGD